MKFIKLQYKDVIKKLLLTQEELTLDHLCEIIMNSFALQQKEKIILKYMDFQKSEISVTSNNELIAALNLYFVQNFIKFFVYYSGVIEDHKQQKSIKEPSISESNPIKENPNPNHANSLLILNLNEIQEIFSSAFEQAKIFRYLHKGLEDIIKKKMLIVPDLSSLSIEYEVESDYLAMAEYFKKILHTTLQSKYDDNLSNSNEKADPLQLPTIQITHKITENNENSKEENEEEKEEINNKIPLDDKNDFENSLIESVYELVENKDSDSSFLTNPIQIINSPLKRSISAQDKKTQFIVTAVERKGKINFKSRAPENYYEMKNIKEEMGAPLLQKSISDISFDFLSFHQTLNIEKNLKKNNNRAEFSNNILQGNETELDKYLPAPYLFDN